ncbi:MAG: filamentous hemagglutinin N-terminal domain-containing protein [Cyanobacteria bacterium J06632_22]
MNCLIRRALGIQAATALAASLGVALWTAPTLADTTLTPGATNTEITPIGETRYEISGGERSAGPAPNVFHHFTQFDVGQGHEAIFVVPASIENVIGLIESADPARINGLLGLTGASSNLYLVSPGGVLFGPEAQLSLPADLMVTTADGLIFNETELVAVQSEGSFDATTLTGTPSAYVFTLLEPTAAIENQGTLEVGDNRSITFLAGNVQTSGSLIAPGGTINLAAVPGGYTVRLSRPGALLSLELTPNQADLPEFTPTPIGPETFGSATLPALLTGGSATSVGEIIENPDGSFSLVGTVTPETTTGPNLDEVGTVVVQGRIDVSDTIGGGVSVVAPRVALIGADITADGSSVAGSIQIGSLPVTFQADAPQNLDTVYIYGDRNTRLSASGLEPDSSGGLIYMWADNTVQYYGGAEVAGESSTLFIDAGVQLQRIVPRTSTRPVRR